MKFDWLIIALLWSQSAWPQSPLIEERAKFWEKHALTCTGEGYAFPSKGYDSENRCEDGDMTLFNGLLCASGDMRGCAAVKASLDEISGLWHRSPRIKLLGKNDRGDADSSPDMALGVQLYLTVTKDVAAARKWFTYLNQTYVCIPTDPSCSEKLPKFCGHINCAMRPQDIMMLKVTVDYLQSQSNLGALPTGSLNDVLQLATGSNAAALELLARVQQPGFPPHLVGVGVLTMRLSGRSEPRLGRAARVLARRFPDNPFFLWLSGAPISAIEASVLQQCPATLKDQIQPWDDWLWESYGARKDGSLPQQHSSFWDCIFMANLLRGSQSLSLNKKFLSERANTVNVSRATSKKKTVR